MANCLYIVATQSRSGKSAIALGVMEMLVGQLGRVAFFRPIIETDPATGVQDHDIQLIAGHYGLTAPYEQMVGCTEDEAMSLISAGKQSAVIDRILERFHALAGEHEFVLCEGTDFRGASSVFEFDINAEIARNLGCPVMLVVTAQDGDREESLAAVELTLESLRDQGCDVVCTLVNRVPLGEPSPLFEALRAHELTRGHLVCGIPEEPALAQPTVAQVAQALQAEVLAGEKQLDRPVYGFQVAAMTLANALPRLERGALVITPGDRVDILIASLASAVSQSLADIAGIVLTGGLMPDETAWRLVQGLPVQVPILSVTADTFPTAARAIRLEPVIEVGNHRKIARAVELFERSVDVEALRHRVVASRPSIVTPKMFEYSLLERARQDKRHIVLPEGEEPRILQAAEILRRREVVDLTLLGRASRVRRAMARLGLQLPGVTIVEPERSEHFDSFVETYHTLRRHKGITKDNARDQVTDNTYFGTLMVHQGLADGMVSGSVHTTAATVRPAFEIIRARAGVSLVSSVFFMCLADRVLVYGDCAVNPDPSASELAEIALSSAETARTFGIEPCVALLSYSSGASGQGEQVDKVREATAIARERAARAWPELPIDGPLQYDAAVDPDVAQTKAPKSPVAGRATVLIFPDLNTGNNTYKAVQRSVGALAVGPVLQGLNRPVNDLSRGCTVPDIINTVAITAIQAQAVTRAP